MNISTKQKKLEELRGEARDLAWAIPYEEDKKKQEIGYKNLDKLTKEINNKLDRR